MLSYTIQGSLEDTIYRNRFFCVIPISSLSCNEFSKRYYCNTFFRLLLNHVLRDMDDKR